MCDVKEAKQILGEAYRDCGSFLPIQDAFLYGSYARGDYDEDSDVDIFFTVDLTMHEIEMKRDMVAEIASDLSLDHDVVVSICVRPVDLFLPEENFYYGNVFREGIRYPLYEAQV